jgi:membrane fusion protein, copper/silver efflux system
MRSGRLLLIVLLAAGAGAAAVLVGPTGLQRLRGGHVLSAKAEKYQCAMHPQIVQDHPGNCPICQMPLQRVDDDATPAAAPVAAADRKPLFYRHPMRPDVTSPSPAKDEMGMDYIPVYMDDLTAHGSDVPGHAAFALSGERQQLIGVRRTRVERKSLDEEIRAVGKVAYDPGLYQAIVEYREALRARHQIANSQLPEAHDGAGAIVRAAGLRLRQLGVSEQQMREIVESGQDPTNLLLPGKSVWVYAQVYEYESDLVKPGAAATLTAPSRPGKTYSARVTSVDPILDPATRTARVRMQVATPDGELRPESFVQVKIRIPSPPRLLIPSDAVLYTGERQIVFAVEGEGEFEPRAVTLGRDTQGYVEVLEGLAEGEEIVTSANFLIDSESRFRAALSAFGK